jgi:hypothetical protein
MAETGYITVFGCLFAVSVKIGRPFLVTGFHCFLEKGAGFCLFAEILQANSPQV